tara:strand:- start:32 stop:238 length:207 start_codon:yes stop_codon:yes gene_type:complete
MKTAEEILQNVSEWQCYKKTSMPTGKELELVIDAMKCYAYKFHEAEILKLNSEVNNLFCKTLGNPLNK